MEPELRMRPAPQATGQANPAGSTGSTIATHPAPLTPPPTPPTSSDHGSQETLPVQDANGRAEETVNLEATALQTAGIDSSATGDSDERRRSADSAPPLSRITTAVESIIPGTTQLKPQASFSISKNEDGVRVWKCSVTLNKAVIFFGVHFVVVFCVSFVGFFLQVWSTVYPAPPGITVDDMQKLLQTSANEGSKTVLAAFEHHVGDESVNWKLLIQVLKACLNYSGNNVSTMTCEAALQSFNKNSSSNGEILRKRAELVNTIHELSLHPNAAPLAPASQYDRGLIVALALCSFLLLIPWVVLLRHYAKPLLSPFFGFFNKATFRHSTTKEPEYTALDEKEEDYVTSQMVGGSTTSISVGNGSSAGGALQRRNHSRQLREEGDIFAAAAQGALDVVEELFYSPKAKGIDSLHPKFGTLLSAAARSGNKRLVNRVLQWKANPAIVGGYYHTVLQSAAHSGKLDVVELLLENKARDDPVGGCYGTALNAAAEKGSLEMLQLLVTKDLKPQRTVNVPGGTYGFPIIAAASRGQLGMIRLLISKGANVNASDDSGTIAIHTAIIGRHADVVDELLSQGSDYDCKSLVYGTPLHAAITSGQEDIALLLVDRGANTGLTDQQSRLPLHEAARMGMERLTLVLLKADGSYVNNTDSGGNTALHHAAIGGYAKITSYLIDHGADVSIGDNFKAEALFRAAGCHHPQVVKLLLEAGADPNARDCFGRTALHGPAQTEDVSVHSMLLEAGADANAVGEDKKTPLHEACNMGRINNVKLLLAQPGIKVNLVDNDNSTPLYKALCSSDGNYKDLCVNREIVELLLERNDIDVNVAYATAVQEAARKGMLDIVQTMLSKRGANISLHGGKYGGVIQAAAIGGDVKTLEVLVSPEWHGNVNAVGGEFGTPLAAAVAFGHYDAARTLLDAGASVDVRNVGRYSSAFHSVGMKMPDDDLLKKQHHCKEIVELLERYAGTSLEHTADMPHLEDRWLLATNGWTFLPKGEL